jgi:hypothetical protein
VLFDVRDLPSIDALSYRGCQLARLVSERRREALRCVWVFSTGLTG